MPSTGRISSPAQPRRTKMRPSPNEHLLGAAHFNDSLHQLFKGRTGLSPTTRVERLPFHRGGSASNRDNPSAPLLPRPRRLMCSIVFSHDDFPDPFVRKFDFPARHRGFPWHPFDREADATLLDAPEEIAFLEHGDRRWIGEVGRGRIESPGRRTLAIEVSAVAGRTERGIEALPLLDGVWCL